jgi:hypothetical protein
MRIGVQQFETAQYLFRADTCYPRLTDEQLEQQSVLRRHTVIAMN